MDATPEQVEAGHAFYTKRALAIYDLAILGYFSRFAWKCPSRRILEHYDEHVSTNHLDVGVGTGYFLDRCRFASPSPRLALMDLNSNCLAVAGRRIARYDPEVYRANVLEPIPFGAPKFDSPRNELPVALPARQHPIQRCCLPAPQGAGEPGRRPLRSDPAARRRPTELAGAASHGPKRARHLLEHRGRS